MYISKREHQELIERKEKIIENNKKTKMLQQTQAKAEQDQSPEPIQKLESV
tara:strand:+ start:1272 stop:1424 length:153 start_codon:yes stop_codon:yes gene_type:complete